MPADPPPGLDDLKTTLDLHQQWLRSDGAEGERAHLADRNFAGWDLNGADLRQANLARADFSGADLADARLDGADLRLTVFFDADLSNADLTNARGLSFQNLARADLTGAILPTSVDLPSHLARLGELSGNARTTFNTLLIASAYCVLTILTTTDENLLRNVSASPIPFTGTETPILWFFILMPAAITGLYLYMLVSFNRLWDAIRRMPAVLPDSSELPANPHCWIFSDVVWQVMRQLRKPSHQHKRMQYSMQSFLCFFVPIFTLLLFWWSYIPLRDERVTWLHGILTITCVTVTLWFYLRSIWGSRSANDEQSLPREFSRARLSGRLTRGNLVPVVALVASGLLIAIVASVSLSVFDGNADRRDYASGTCPPATALRFLCLFNKRSYVDVRQTLLSSLPPNWQDPDNLGIKLDWSDRAGSSRIRKYFAAIDGAELSGFDLSYANARGAFLAEAWLDEAILNKADFKFADLRFASLYQAEATGAYFSYADLRHANLANADFSGAFLDNADLRGANLTGANLADATLGYVDFGGANLRGANLSSAKLSNNEFITTEQLDAACADVYPQLPQLLRGYRLPKCTKPGLVVTQSSQ